MFHRARKDSPAEQLEYARHLRDSGKLQNAGRQYLALVHAWHGSPEAPVAQLEYAQLLERRGKGLDAFEEYQYLIDNYAGSFDYGSALSRQFEIASNIMATRSKFLGIFGNAGNLKDALPLFEQIVSNGPGWENTPQAQFNVALIQENLSEHELAIDAYETVRQRYPTHPLAVDAAFKEGNCLYRLAIGRKYEEYSMQLARSHLDRVVKSYPTHRLAESSKAELAEINARLEQAYWQRAAFYDRFGKHPKAALLAYTDFLNMFPGAGMADKARARITELKTVVGPEEPVSPVSRAGDSENGGGNQ
jgi:outer membrane protein assembly factor BamD (BamD/ComL family)